MISRLPDQAEARQASLRDATSVYDLLTIGMARRGQYAMLSEVECPPSHTHTHTVCAGGLRERRRALRDEIEMSVSESSAFAKLFTKCPFHFEKRDSMSFCVLCLMLLEIPAFVFPCHHNNAISPQTSDRCHVRTLWVIY